MGIRFGWRALLVASVAFASAAGAQERAALLERVDAARDVTFTVYLPLSHRADLDRLLAAQITPGSPLYRHWLSPADFSARFGADAGAVGARLRAEGFRVVSTDAHGITVHGPAALVERAFGTQLHRARFANGVERVAAGRPLVFSPELARAGAVVPDFDPVIRAAVHSKIVPFNRSGSYGPYWFTDLKQAYQYPAYTALTGKGARIGILMSGGFQQSDMNLYFNHEGLNSPLFFNLPVYGGLPFSTSNSGETQLDLQQSGGMAPQAQIGLYNIPDLSDASIFAGLTKITRGNIADVVSMSFGASELSYTPAYSNGVNYTGYITIEDDFFKQGNAQGITFVASSGDYGSSPLPVVACIKPGAGAGCGGFVKTVEIPASSPHVVAVGGTNLMTAHTPGSTNSAYVSEMAFGDKVIGDPETHTHATGAQWASGGGFSVFFAAPSWQAFKFRAVPDLALHMGGCPSSAVTPCQPGRSADVEIIGGQMVGTIGTSASAPDFAGLVALIVQDVGSRLGNISPVIYSLAAAQAKGGPAVFHTGIKGNNGVYSSGAGYNAVIGNGTLHANLFVNAKNPPPAAGLPGSASNP